MTGRGVATGGVGLLARLRRSGSQPSNSPRADPSEREIRAAAEVTRCREEYPDGLLGAARVISVTRIDKYRKGEPRTAAGAIALWVLVAIMISAALFILAMTILTFPMLDVVPLEHGNLSIYSALIFIACLFMSASLCSDDAFARGSGWALRAIDVFRVVAVLLAQFGSAGVAIVWIVLGLQGSIADLDGEIVLSLLMIQAALVGFAAGGLGMVSPLIDSRQKGNRTSRMHYACTVLYFSLLVLLSSAAVAVSRGSSSGALPVALFFTVATWTVVQLAAAREKIDESMTDAREVLTELEIAFRLMRTCGAGLSFSAEQGAGVLRLQSLLHTPLPALVPGMSGRPRADFSTLVVADYLAFRVSGDRATSRVEARSDWFGGGLDSCSNETIQYLIADFISDLRHRCLSIGS